MSYRNRSAILAALAMSSIVANRFDPRKDRANRTMANKIIQFGGYGDVIASHNKPLYKRMLKRRRRNAQAKLSRRINRER